MIKLASKSQHDMDDHRKLPPESKLVKPNPAHGQRKSSSAKAPSTSDHTVKPTPRLPAQAAQDDE
jgi:hypothetical protein